MSSPLRLVLADDHPLFRLGLRQVFVEAHIVVVGEAASGEEALRVVLETLPDIVVMDVRLPRMDGIEAMLEIKRRLPRTEVVLMTAALEDEEQVARALHAGACAYVGKSEPAQVMVAAVQNAYNGEPFLSQEAIRLVMRYWAGPRAGLVDQPPQRVLSAREMDVLRALMATPSKQEIAHALGLSVHTVSNHLESIYRKLRVHRRLEILLYATRFAIPRAMPAPAEPEALGHG